MIELSTTMPDLKLITPDVERDAPASVGWLEGELGRNTLRLMGNTDKNNHPSTLDAERERVNASLISTDRLTWTISYKGKPVGATWLDLEASDYLPGPSVHIMIGDPEVRGLGVGTQSIAAVIGHLQQQQECPALYSRYLLENTGSAAMLTKLGFTELEDPYHDTNDLVFQNVVLSLR